MTGCSAPPKIRRFPWVGGQLKLEQLYNLISADMQSVDAVIRTRLHSDVVLVRQVAEYIIQSGGKRLRPALVLTALVAGVLFFALPALTQSSFANMGYWVDWANLLAVALGLGAVVGVFCIPVAALLCPRCALKVR